MNRLKRRDFITLLGGGAVFWPGILRAQQATMPVIGWLNSGTQERFADMVEAFRQGLATAGYVERKNVAIDYRWANGQLDRLPALAADLVERKVDVIAAVGGTAAALAAKGATSTIPVVFEMGGDPVQNRLVASLSRPGGNVTGVSLMAVILEAKRLELISEILPKAENIAFLVASNNPNAEFQSAGMLESARRMGRNVHVLKAGTEAEIDSAFATMLQRKTDALIVAADLFFNLQRHQIVALAAQHSIPTIYERREYIDVGGLIGYGADFANAFRETGIYTARVLKGAMPADLPVLLPTKFELIINLKTAEALRLTIPRRLRLSADRVIE